MVGAFTAPAPAERPELTMRPSTDRFLLALGTLACLALPHSALAQRSRHADVWSFGTRCRLSFSADAMTVTPGTDPAISTAEGSASLSDPASGELLVSSDGITVWDGDGAMVATGLEGDTSSMHSGVIIPRPLTPNRLFVITHAENATATVAYREIDTTGPVTAVGSNVVVTLDGGTATGREGMLLIQHANEVDYWLLVSGDGVVFVLPVTIDGIGAPVRVPTSVPLWTTGWNIFAASNAGDRLVISSNSSVEGLPRPIVAFDFDRATGALSGRTQLTSGLDREYYGGAFSPDDSKLYFSTLTSRVGMASTPQVSRVYQYDFDTGVFTVLDERMPVYSNGQARLGPDGRVYIATGTVPDASVSVIDSPNAAGTACGFRWGAISMPSPCSPSLGLPQTVSPTARLRFGIDILAPVGSIGGTTATPTGTANVADGQTITVTVTGPGGFTGTCTAVVSMQRWSCPDGSITGLAPGDTYTITASLSPTVSDRDSFTVLECLRDADCDTAAEFCDTAMNRCVPRIPNGDPVPTIEGHDPALDGTCTSAAANAACLSRLCEDDDLCGLRPGSTCTAAEQCRSFICAPSGVCGVCDERTPCPTGEVCNVADGTCRAAEAPDAGVSDAGVSDAGLDGRPGGLAGGACGCSVREDSPARAWALALAGLFVAVVRRRRRR